MCGIGLQYMATTKWDWPFTNNHEMEWSVAIVRKQTFETNPLLPELVHVELNDGYIFEVPHGLRPVAASFRRISSIESVCS